MLDGMYGLAREPQGDEQRVMPAGQGEASVWGGHRAQGRASSSLTSVTEIQSLRIQPSKVERTRIGEWRWSYVRIEVEQRGEFDKGKCARRATGEAVGVDEKGD